MIALLLILVVTTVAVWVFMQKPEFGTLPSGERLERIKKSPHFERAGFTTSAPLLI